MLELVYVENTDLCRSVSTRIYYRSQHGEGDRGGRLQQRNGGVGGSCYLDEKKSFYWALGGLENSQFGPTLAIGPGMRFRTPPLLRLSIEAGVELPIVHYASPRRYTEVWGPIPVFYRGISIELPRIGYTHLGYLTIEERTLGWLVRRGEERVRLYSLEWRYQF